MAEKYDYTNEALIKKTLGLMVKSGKLIQEGQTFYAKGFKPEPEPEEWKPLAPDEKHSPRYEGMYSEGFPKAYQSEIENSDERSFWKFIFNMYQLEVLYRATGDEQRADTFNTAWSYMLDCSNHNYEDQDKHGNYIGIGHEDMSSNMLANDVKCLRDIYGVGASTVKLIEEWIETGKLKRLEDLKKKCSASVLKQFELEAKHDFMPGFCKTLETAGYDNMDMYGLGRVLVYNVKDLDKLKDKVKPDILEMFKEYIETKKIKKLTKTLCVAFIENHEPLRNYCLKKPIHLSFDQDDPEWNYSGKAQKLDIVISCVFQQCVLQEHDFEDILEGDKYDIDQLRNKVQEIQERLDNGDSTTCYNFEGSFTIDGVPGQHPFKFYRYIDDSDTGLESLGWTPPGLETFLNKELMGERGHWNNQVDSDIDSDAPRAEFLMDMFGDKTEHECEAMYDHWMESGRHTYEAETDEDTT